MAERRKTKSSNITSFGNSQVQRFHSDIHKIIDSKENDFYEVEQAVGDPYGLKLPNKFGVDFIEPDYPKSESEKIQRDDWDLMHGQTTLAEIMVRNNKDLTLEEAERKTQENLEKNLERLKLFTPPQFQNNNEEESENDNNVRDWWNKKYNS